jgi:guanylate kinase
MSGKLLIFSAPSGSGKTTIVRHLLSKFPQLGFSISCCTRPIRAGETDGEHYYYLTQEDFENRIAKNEFVEWEEVYKGSYYGTLKQEVERLWALGKTVIFDVDVKGGLNLKDYYKEKALAIYVDVSDLEEVKKRLKTRGTETEESLKKRIEKMQEESSYKNQFDLLLNNDVLEQTFMKAEKLVSDFLAKK